MVLDIMAVLKALWGFATFILLGILKITYSDFKKMQERQDELEKDILRLRMEVIKKDDIDGILDRKLKHVTETIQDIRSDITDMRSEARNESNAMRSELRALMSTLMESKRDK